MNPAISAREGCADAAVTAPAPQQWALMVLALIGALVPPEPRRPGPSQIHLAFGGGLHAEDYAEDD